MRMFRKLAMAGVIATVGLGCAATGALAYSWSGGPYVGTATTAHSYSVGGFYTITCPAASTTFTGSATGSATTSFTPSYGPGCTYFGLPVIVSQSGMWELRVTSGLSGGSQYGADVHIPAGTTTTITIPPMGCSQTISGPQTFTGAATLVNITSGVSLSANAAGIVYSSSGCPFGSGSDGVYNTNGNVDFPGVAVS